MTFRLTCVSAKLLNPSTGKERDMITLFLMLKRNVSILVIYDLIGMLIW